MAVITSTQTDARSPVNVSLMDELRRRSNGMPQPGTIIQFHSFNGTIKAGAGWFPCTGGIINQANYDSYHGTGKWASDIGTSLLDGKYSPNLVGKYAVGVASTTATGAGAIPAVGNPSNVININHTHVVADHRHQWLGVQQNYSSTNDRQTTFDVNGALLAVNDAGTSVDVAQGARFARATTPAGSADTLLGPCYTNSQTIAPAAALSTSQSIQPESIQVEYYIMII